eukprot:TRINITY_DN1477_c0_g1_i18.p1 TRINITY_DN1477_c0_g1~~TRINITY_DN1477_c0_g1_i18.p1  ORF type:complete len:324 (-),score=25.50 TRINITY_DN1477_c0_g1_i18:16-987(-)
MKVFLFALFALASAIPLKVSITSDVVKLDPLNEAYELQFSLTNTHTAPLVLVKWNTPLDRLKPFPSDMFYIRSLEGQTSPVYIGVAQKRFPIAMDFVTIQPNETLTSSFDLLQGYWFSSLGEHEVFFSSSVLVYEGLVDTYSLEKFESIPLASSSIFVTMTNRVPMPSLPVPSHPWVNNSLGAITAFSNCSTTIQDQSRSADTTATSLLNSVNTYLKGSGCNVSNVALYTTWFGACTPARYSTVTNHFTAIQNRRNSGYRIACGDKNCGPGTFAFVYPSDTTYTVYVCSGYNNAPSCAKADTKQIGRAVQQECRDRSRMPSSA